MIPAHLYGLPPAVIRMRGRREREEERAFMRATVDQMNANGAALESAITRLVSMQHGEPAPRVN